MHLTYITPEHVSPSEFSSADAWVGGQRNRSLPRKSFSESVSGICPLSQSQIPDLASLCWAGGSTVVKSEQGEKQFSLCVEEGSDHLRGHGVQTQQKAIVLCGKAREAEQHDPESSNLQGSQVGATAEVTSPGFSPGTLRPPGHAASMWMWAALCTGRRGLGSLKPFRVVLNTF